MKSEVIIGDCRDILKTLPDESVDCIVTDPPYGYSFMGLAWDKALPSEEALKECCRVLKPGAFGFFMCAPRQDVLSRMIIRLEDAGFNTGFSSIYWSFASGFPKASAIDKLIDKRNGRKPEEYKALGDYLRTQRELKGLSQKDIAVYFPSKTGGLTGCYWNWENSANVPTLEQWGILKELLVLDSRFDELIEREEAEREIIGKQSYTVPKELYQVGLAKEGTREDALITAPSTDKAKEFDGSYAGFQPKPAVEIIIVCMKSLSEKTYIDQALVNGKGCVWLDSVRIPYPTGDNAFENGVKRAKSPRPIINGGNFHAGLGTDNQAIIESGMSSEGRFPANLLVSDNILDRGIITTSKAGIRKNNTVLGVITKDTTTTLGKGEAYSGCNDSGDFSRYFSLDAWWSKKITELPPEQQKTFPFLITPKPSKSEKNKYIENKHPTVKPLKLMSYLITMGSREGDVILDPFAGSGTTLEACKLLNRTFIGIDKDPGNEKYMRARGQLDKPTLESFQEVQA